MLTTRLSRVLAAALAFLIVVAFASSPAAAQGAALSGQVSSAEEGPMEGVVVSAKKQGATVTLSVVTNSEGRYSFPAARLDAGQYALEARAAGYDLDGPKSATVTAGQNSAVDLKLKKTRNISRQLTNAEWMMSAPGTDEDRSGSARRPSISPPST